MYEQFDPIPLGEPTTWLSKFEHIFEEGQRVRVKATGHTGLLTAINAHSGHVVRLDSGHFIECQEDEIEPEDFLSSYDELEPKKVVKVSDVARELLAPFAKMSGALLRAAEAGTMSDHDRIVALRCIKTISENRQVSDPFGEVVPEEITMLKILAEKYAATTTATTISAAKPASDSLAKAEGFRRSRFYVGQKVRDRSDGRTATVTKVEGGAVHVDYGGGSTGMATNDHFEPLEAVA